MKNIKKKKWGKKKERYQDSFCPKKWRNRKMSLNITHSETTQRIFTIMREMFEHDNVGGKEGKKIKKKDLLESFKQMASLLTSIIQ
jgi:hypothetical protein